MKYVWIDGPVQFVLWHHMMASHDRWTCEVHIKTSHEIGMQINIGAPVLHGYIVQLCFNVYI